MKVESVRKNALMNAVLKMSNVIFPLITYPYVSRILHPEGLGRVTFASSVVAYFSMLAQLGVPTYGIRACAVVRDDREQLSRTTQELLIINLLMCLVSYGLLALAAGFLPALREDRKLLAIQSATILLTAVGMEWLYQALEQYRYITRRSIAFKFIALLATFALIHSEGDYLLYGAVTIFAASASDLCNFFYVRRYIKVKPLGHYDFRRHLRPIAIFFAMACATTIYTQMDSTMLGLLVSKSEVGLYDAAVKVKLVLVSLVTSLGTVLLPRVSYDIARRDMDDFHRLADKAIHFVLLFSLPLMLYFMLFSRETVMVLSGETFAGAVMPMRLIMPTLVLIGLTNILGIQMLVPLGREKDVLYSEIWGAGVNLLVNVLLIPSHGASGAAVGTLCAETAVFLYQVRALKKEHIRVPRSGIAAQQMAAALLLSGMTAMCTRVLPGGNLLTLVVSSAVFFGGYVFMLLAQGDSLMWEIWGEIRRRL
jgi:O-antigen/teichoic acid export membrane protein